MEQDKDALITRSIHAGELPDSYGSPHTPLYDTTTFRFASTQDLLDVIEERRTGYLYTRYGSNPSIHSIEAKLALLDGSEGAMVFSSGMAALSALFLGHGRKGIICIGETYGGTDELLAHQLPGLGIQARFLRAGDDAGLQAALEAGAGLVFFETPSNPTLEVIDIRKVAALAHAAGALVAIDNTFASPVNQRPLALGADLAMQSATKYLGGHSDITGGVLSGSLALLEAVRPWRKNLGQMMAPSVAHLLARSLLTLVLRVEKQNVNAMTIARTLEAHPRIRKVYYPGLESFPGHAIAAAQMSGFGGMLSIEIDGTEADAIRVSDQLRLFVLAPSLGGVESLVTMPSTTSHHGLPPEERRRRGIPDSLIRLSVGIEDVNDLLRDLMQALER